MMTYHETLRNTASGYQKLLTITSDGPITVGEVVTREAEGYTILYLVDQVVSTKEENGVYTVKVFYSSKFTNAPVADEIAAIWANQTQTELALAELAGMITGGIA